MAIRYSPACLFNVCVVAPEGFIHYRAFDEIKDLLVFGLRDLGFVVTEGLNRVEKGSINILIGVHLLDLRLMQSMPDNTIVLNTEQIGNASSPWESQLLQWCSAFETWDYSLANIERFRVLGIANVRHFRIGYHPSLCRIPKQSSPEIDILFYGSLGSRRKKILSDLKSTKLNIKVVFGAYGAERDALIANSKVVLNLHHFDTKVFEIVRVFYLLTNSKAVVAEVGLGTCVDEMYVPGFYSADYEGLVQACVNVASNDELRMHLEGQAFSSISKFPQADLLQNLL